MDRFEIATQTYTTDWQRAAASLHAKLHATSLYTENIVLYTLIKCPLIVRANNTIQVIDANITAQIQAQMATRLARHVDVSPYIRSFRKQIAHYNEKCINPGTFENYVAQFCERLRAAISACDTTTRRGIRKANKLSGMLGFVELAQQPVKDTYTLTQIRRRNRAIYHCNTKYIRARDKFDNHLGEWWIINSKSPRALLHYYIQQECIQQNDANIWRSALMYAGMIDIAHLQWYAAPLQRSDVSHPTIISQQVHYLFAMTTKNIFAAIGTNHVAHYFKKMLREYAAIDLANSVSIIEDAAAMMTLAGLTIARLAFAYSNTSPFHPRRFLTVPEFIELIPFALASAADDTNRNYLEAAAALVLFMFNCGHRCDCRAFLTLVRAFIDAIH